MSHREVLMGCCTVLIILAWYGANLQYIEPASQIKYVPTPKQEVPQYKMPLHFDRYNNTKREEPEAAREGRPGEQLGPSRPLVRFFRQDNERMEVSSDLDISRESIKEGTIWLPIEVGWFKRTPGQQGGPFVKMCLMDWSMYQDAPWVNPMFEILQKKQCRSLTAKSQNRVVIVPFDVALSKIEEEPIPPSGFIYHQTRCGSTLLSNQLSVLKSNRVFSEAKPNVQCLRMHLGLEEVEDRLTVEELQHCFSTVLKLFGRKRRAEGGLVEPHLNMFIKFQNSKFSSIVTDLYPQTPWVYLFRDPVEVMVSNIGHDEKSAPCVRDAMRKDKAGDDRGAAHAQEHGRERQPDINGRKLVVPKPAQHPITRKKLSRYCAEWLLGLDNTVLEAYAKIPQLGFFAEYTQFPSVTPDYLYPSHFKVHDANAAWRSEMARASAHYSKGKSKNTPAVDDSLNKHAIATPEIKFAAGSILNDSYAMLQHLAEETRSRYSLP